MGQIRSVLLALPLTPLHLPHVLLLPRLPPSARPPRRLCFPSVSLSLTLSHAVSEQTVLSRSISGCHAVEEKNKIKNGARKREIFPRGLRI